MGNKVYSLGKFSLCYKVECYLSNFISTQMFKRKWREISGVFNLWEQLFEFQIPRKFMTFLGGCESDDTNRRKLELAATQINYRTMDYVN